MKVDAMLLVAVVVALLALFIAALLAPAPWPPRTTIKPRWKGCPVLPLQRWRGECRGWVLL